MRTPILPTLLAVLLLALALPTAPASANGSDDRIIQDCQHSATGALGGTYSQAQLRHALNNLPGDVLEYSGCYDAIRQAMRATAGDDGDGGSGPGGGGGTGGIGGTGADGPGDGTPGGAGGAAPPATPHTGTEKPVQLAGTPVEPGALPALGQDAHDLPPALIVLLIALGVAALVPAALTIGRRVVAQRRA